MVEILAVAMAFWSVVPSVVMKDVLSVDVSVVMRAATRATLKV